jgi:hypothetical protein
MQKNEYSTAGWAALAAAASTPVMMAVGIALDVVSSAHPLLLATLPVVAVANTGLGVFALHRFRKLLNDRFAFHDADRLVSILIVGAFAVQAISVPGRLLLGSGWLPRSSALGFTIALFLVGVPLAIVSLIFAIRLRRLDGDATGYLRPYANATLAAGICLATFVLAPIGLLLNAVAQVLLGLLLLHPDPKTATPEFV